MQLQPTNQNQMCVKRNLARGLSVIFVISAVLIPYSLIPVKAQENPRVNISSVASQASNRDNQTIQQITQIDSTTFSGELDRKENDKIFVSKDNQVRQYIITDNVKIRRDNSDVDINSLKIGDSVTVKQSQDGQKIFSLEAISKQNDDNIKWAIAVAIVTLLLMALATYLYNKFNKSHIRANTYTNK